MSKYTVGEATYVCNGCEYGPSCSGHKMKVLMDCSTDTYIVEVGARSGAYDENYIHAIMKCLTPPEPEPADHSLGLRQNKWVSDEV